MKKLRLFIFIITLLILIFLGVFVSVGVLNSDLYGRLTETVQFNTFNSPKNETDTVPKITFIIHKYLTDENSIEVSIILTNPRQVSFSGNQFKIRVSDGYNYNPSGFSKIFSFIDSSKNYFNSYQYSGFESEKFLLPVAPSLNGFPFDEIKVRPFVELEWNNVYSIFNIEVQKRFPGRVISIDKKDKEIIVLTRTPTEKYLVVISSVLFLLLTLILTYSLFTHKSGLNTIEELIAVAGYILATAGFRDIVGFNRNYGTSALEILVILIPLLFVTIALIFSFVRGLKTRQ